MPSLWIYSWIWDVNKVSEDTMSDFIIYLDVQLSHDPSRNTSFPPWLHVIRVGIPFSWEWLVPWWWTRLLHLSVNGWKQEKIQQVSEVESLEPARYSYLSVEAGPAAMQINAICPSWKWVKQYWNMLRGNTPTIKGFYSNSCIIAYISQHYRSLIGLAIPFRKVKG